MTKMQVEIKGEKIDLTIHLIDDEVSEVYASWNDTEIAFGYDIDECLEKVYTMFNRAAGY